MASIRRATEDDIPRILELYNEQLVLEASPAESQQNPSIEDYRKVFSEIDALPGCELLVAEEQGKVVGTTVLAILPNLSHSALPWAIVENVVVDSEYRRRGIGRLLMDYVVAMAREAGCYKVQLMSSNSRHEAHKFYESIGYRASAVGFRRYL
jgi:L-amino acid N-acyltransferase YncA